jgi:hypothetical protein
MKNSHTIGLNTRLLICTILLAVLAACGGGSGSSSSNNINGSSPVATVTAPSSVIGEQAGYAASVPMQTGCTYSWTITNGTIMVGESSDSVAFTPGSSGTVTLTCKVTNSSNNSTTGNASISITAASSPAYNITQA